MLEHCFICLYLTTHSNEINIVHLIEYMLYVPYKHSPFVLQYTAEREMSIQCRLWIYEDKDLNVFSK